MRLQEKKGKNPEPTSCGSPKLLLALLYGKNTSVQSYPEFTNCQCSCDKMATIVSYGGRLVQEVSSK